MNEFYKTEKKVTMADNHLIHNLSKPLRVISITGGKGGIGKTTLSVNMAIAFAKMKKKTLLFDADLSLANVDVMLGLKPKRTIHDFLTGECELADVCMNGPHGIKIIPASSGIQKMAELTSGESTGLIQSFSSLAEELDVMIIDHASGISTQVMALTHASQDILVIICNDPASLMDSYAVIKILHQKYARSRFGIIVNKAKHLQEGFDVFTKFQEAIAKFMHVSIHYLGHIPYDDYVSISAREHVSIIERFPNAAASVAINELCHGILHWRDNESVAGGIHFFFERLIQHNQILEGEECKA